MVFLKFSKILSVEVSNLSNQVKTMQTEIDELRETIRRDRACFILGQVITRLRKEILFQLHERKPNKFRDDLDWHGLMQMEYVESRKKPASCTVSDLRRQVYIDMGITDDEWRRLLDFMDYVRNPEAHPGLSLEEASKSLDVVPVETRPAFVKAISILERIV